MAISKINGGKNSKRKSGFFGIAIIAVVALSIVALIFWKKLDLEKELEIKQQQLDGYNAQIETAHAKTAEIENEIKYRETDDYIKDEARDIFGLHESNEVIFEAKDLESGK